MISSVDFGFNCGGLSLFYGYVYDCCCNALFLMFVFVVLCWWLYMG